MKFIFVSGGVISGLGKGITSASIALLLESHGIKTAPIKCDAYMNLDAGTIRPQEHGEVFVTQDGMECDQDLGNYERFLGRNLFKENYLTNGQIYSEIIRKERAFEYDGEDVEIVPHVPEEMIRRFKLAGKKNNADVVIIEIGGTVGEYQNALFIEANRIMKYRDHEDVIHVHVGYLPTPGFLGEMKSKPVQTSVRTLSGSGIMPDFIIGRAEKAIDKKRKQRIAWLCNIDEEFVISNPDVKSIYEIPEIFKAQDFDKKILKKLGLKSKKNDFSYWKKLINNIKKSKKDVNIAMIGKYFTTGDYVLTDSYISVIESLKHAAWSLGYNPILTWLNSEDFEKDPKKLKNLQNFDAIVVPGGFGKRGTEGIIAAIEYARTNKIPYLGLCYGMQLATVEFARNVAKMKKANTTEVDEKTKFPIIHIMSEQEKKMLKKEYGGTMRLGVYPTKIIKDTNAFDAYKNDFRPVRQAQGQKSPLVISERHRHRFEFNNKYRKDLENAGLKITGTSPDNKIVEIIELDKKIHPFFVGVQFHPEFQSWPTQPHPLFVELIKQSKN